jgi:hypothetical protein
MTLGIGNDDAMTTAAGALHPKILKRLIYRFFRLLETNET